MSMRGGATGRVSLGHFLCRTTKKVARPTGRKPSSQHLTKANRQSPCEMVGKAKPLPRYAGLNINRHTSATSTPSVSVMRMTK